MTVIGEQYLNTHRTGAQTRPVIARLGSQRFVAVWESTTPDADGSVGLFARVFDAASGAALGAEFRVAVTPEGVESRAAVTALSPTSFAVSWVSATGTGPLPLQGRIFSVSDQGVATGSAADIDLLSSDADSVLSATAQGGFWLFHVAVVGSDRVLRWQAYGSDGVASGGPISVASVGASARGFAITTLSSGERIVVWDELVPGSTTQQQIMALRLQANGVPTAAGAFALVTPAANQTALSPSLEATPDGGYLVGWQQGSLSAEGTVSHWQARGRVYAANDTGSSITFTSTQSLTATASTPSREMVDVSVAEDGGLVLAYAVDLSGSDRAQTQVARYAAGQGWSTVNQVPTAGEGLGVGAVLARNGGEFLALTTRTRGTDAEIAAWGGLIAGNSSAPRLSGFADARNVVLFDAAGSGIRIDGSIVLQDVDSASLQGARLTVDHSLSPSVFSIGLIGEGLVLAGETPSGPGVQLVGNEVWVHGEQVGVWQAAASGVSAFQVVFGAQADTDAVRTVMQALSLRLSDGSTWPSTVLTGSITLSLVDSAGQAMLANSVWSIGLQTSSAPAALVLSQVDTQRSVSAAELGAGVRVDGQVSLTWPSSAVMTPSDVGSVTVTALQAGTQLSLVPRIGSSLTVVGSDVLDAGVVIGSLIAGGPGSESLQIRFTETAAAASIERVIESLQLRQTGTSVGDTLSVELNLGDGFGQTSRHLIHLNVRADVANQPQVLLPEQPGSVQRVGLAPVSASLIGASAGATVVAALSTESGFAQRFDASGAPLGQQIRLGLDPVADRELSVAALNDGGFVLAWLHTVSTTPAASEYRARLFDAEGLPRSAEFVLATSADGALSGLSLTGLGHGGFVASYQQGLWYEASTAGADQEGGAIYLRTFGADGAALTSATLVNEGTANSQESPSVTRLSSTQFLVSWRADVGEFGGEFPVPGPLYGRVFNNDGSAAAGELVLLANPDAGARDPVALGLTGGGFVLAWRDQGVHDTLGGVDQIRIARFDAAGAMVGTPVLVAAETTTFSGAVSAPHLMQLAQGDLVVGWTNAAGLQVQRLTTSLGLVGGPTLVDTPVQADAGALSLAAVLGSTGSAATQFLVSWAGVDATSDIAGSQVSTVLMGDAGSASRSTAPRLSGFDTLRQVSTTQISGAGGLLLDSDGLVNLIDADSPSMQGGEITAFVLAVAGETVTTSSLQSEVLSVRHQGTGAGQVGFDGRYVSVGGVTIGGVVMDGTIAFDGRDGRALRISLNAQATPQRVGQVLANLTLGTSLDPMLAAPVNSRDIAVRVADGGHGVSTAALIRVVADAPLLVHAGQDTMLAVGRSFSRDIRIVDNADVLPLGRTVSINWGDGSAPVVVNNVTTPTYTITHDAFAAAPASALTVQVTVSDQDGQTATDSFVLDVRAVGSVQLGTEGADVLTGTTGADWFEGLAGNDSYLINHSGDTITEVAGAGTDSVDASIDLALPEHVENLRLLAAASNGSGNASNNRITGNALDNWLSGLAGDDTLIGDAGHDSLLGGEGADRLEGGDGDDLLDGSAGADTMIGGAGNDTYWVNEAADEVVEADGGGIDTVNASGDYVLYANIENLTMGAGSINGSGNAGSNWMVGNAANNWMGGGAGGDAIFGGQGHDYLRGDDGDDVLYGEAGNDTLEGNAGNDQLIGGEGDDKYIVWDLGDVIVELAGGGVDTVEAHTDNYVLYANIENVILADGSLSGSGNAYDNWMEGNSGANFLGGGDGHDYLIGYSGNDYLKGDEGDDVLEGGDGDDVLEGNFGVDRMIGGNGNDTYYVDGPGDFIVETSTGGIDTIYCSGFYTLSGNIENLVMTGLQNVDGTGDSGSNWMSGNPYNNVLSGMAGDDAIYGNDGDDTLVGGTGADLLEGGAGSDTYRYAAGDGTDTVRESGNPAGGMDALVFATGLNAADLWFSRSADDLIITRVGAAGADQIQIASWYASANNKLERITDGSGKTLSLANAEQLVTALAGFVAPVPGTVSLGSAARSALDAAVTSYWAAGS